MLVSNPMISSRMCRVLFLVTRRRSGRSESPVIREGDRKAGRSTYMEQLGSADNVLAIKFRPNHVSKYIYVDLGTIYSWRRHVVVFLTEDRESMQMTVQ